MYTFGQYFLYSDPQNVPVSCPVMEVISLTSFTGYAYKPSNRVIYLRGLCQHRFYTVKLHSLKVTSHTWLNEQHFQIWHSRKGLGCITNPPNHTLVKRGQDLIAPMQIHVVWKAKTLSKSSWTLRIQWESVITSKCFIAFYKSRVY